MLDREEGQVVLTHAVFGKFTIAPVFYSLSMKDPTPVLQYWQIGTYSNERAECAKVNGKDYLFTLKIELDGKSRRDGKKYKEVTLLVLGPRKEEQEQKATEVLVETAESFLKEWMAANPDTVKEVLKAGFNRQIKVELKRKEEIIADLTKQIEKHQADTKSLNSLIEENK